MSSLPTFSGHPPAVSVVIPAFNEAKNIGRSLGALRVQSLPKQNFEIIVVDNGSTDNTMEEASRFTKELPLQVINKTNCRISAVRNFGASLAKGTVLAFLDADCIPPERWLEDALALGTIDSVWGAHYLVPKDSTWVGKVWSDHQAKPQEGPTSFIPGSNLFIYRAAFAHIGGFGEALETSEDVELSQRAKRFGMSVLAFPKLAVYHEGTPQTLRHFYRQNRWHGTTVLRIFFANLPSTANLPLVALSLYTLIMLWAFILGLPFALARQSYWLATTPLILLCLPALLLSGWKTMIAGTWADAPKLFILYMTYLLARAASLTKLSKRNHR